MRRNVSPNFTVILCCSMQLEDMARTLPYAILAIFLTTFTDGWETYNDLRSELLKKYPEYGTKWMYFPNDKEIPTFALLDFIVPLRFFEDRAKNVAKSMTFTLYTRSNKNGTVLSLNKNCSDAFSNINFNKVTKFVTHGYLSRGSSSTCQNIKNAYLEHQDVNVIILDWSPVAGSIFYYKSAIYTKHVGHNYAQLLDRLIKHGAKADKIHLIGHSLGAHVSGYAGRNMTKGKIGRITGLDPALPGFVRRGLIPVGLNDAEYVDIIHSCGNALGLKKSIGHADFYPNGGSPPQPGCTGIFQMIEGCSHGRSWKYFAETINPKIKYSAKRCGSWNEHQENKCEHEFSMMGEPALLTARGSYFLTTKKNAPYGEV